MCNFLYDQIFANALPEAVAIEASTHCLTYEQLQTETAKMAGALVALGVHPGDRVAVQVEKSVANLILYLATVRAGAVFLPLNTGYTLAEMAYFLKDAEPALVVCDPAAREALSSLAAGLQTLDNAGQGTLFDLAAVQPDQFNTVPRAPEDLAAICYTSGTTGRSKGAMLSHRALASNAQTLKVLWRFTAEDILIHALPTYHVHGLFVATNVILMAGGRIILQSRFDPDAVIEAMARATTLMGVPTFYTRLLKNPGLTPASTAGMRLFISGSAPLLAETHMQWLQATGQAILERYGMTETGMNTSNPYEGQRIAGTVGLALPGVCVRTTHPDTGQVLPADEIGMIEVKGPNLFTGYWRMPDKTATEFRADGYFITGDLGVIDHAGYLSIVGRDKDLIISGGLNIYPKEVESLIDILPCVVESAVIGVPHPDFGEAVIAVIATGGEQLDEPSILAHLERQLARFKQPKRLIVVDDLPRNAMGKVQKAALRARYAGLFD